MKPKIFLILIILSLTISITSCDLLGGTNDTAVDALSDQVAALSTQNALLMEKMEEDEADPNTAEAAPTATDAPIEKPTEFVIPSATPESLPTEPVMAGTPIIYDGWSIMVSKDIDTGTYSCKDCVHLTLYIRNLTDTDRTFRFTNATIQLWDNLGNQYQPHRSEECLFDVKNHLIRSEEQAEFSGEYNTCSHSHTFPNFIGPIPLEAGHLIVKFDNFGPLSGVEVIIDL